MPKEKTKAAPKKRGRKPKPKTNVVKPPPKKRGRKPKGGKIIKKTPTLNNTVINKQPNIILHLKCSSKELDHMNDFSVNYNPNINNPEAYKIALLGDSMIENAYDDAMTQAQEGNSESESALFERYGKNINIRNFDGKKGVVSELDAIIAYLQVLGTMANLKDYDPDILIKETSPE